MDFISKAYADSNATTTTTSTGIAPASGAPVAPPQPGMMSMLLPFGLMFVVF